MVLTSTNRIAPEDQKGLRPDWATADITLVRWQFAAEVDLTTAADLALSPPEVPQRNHWLAARLAKLEAQQLIPLHRSISAKALMQFVSHHRVVR